MIETFFILHRGGEILFRWTTNEESDKQFSFNVFIKRPSSKEEKWRSTFKLRSGLKLSLIGWITYDELELVFLVSNQKSLTVPYLHDFLVQVRCACVDVLFENSQSTSTFARVFDEIFEKIRLRCINQFADEAHKDRVNINSSGTGVDDLTQNRLDFSSDRSKGKFSREYGIDIENSELSKGKDNSPSIWVTEKIFKENLRRS